MQTSLLSCGEIYLSMATPGTGLVLAKIHPSYLHTNAQNHLWVFSAIAELIDNAYDPDVLADLLQIKEEKRSGKQCMLFVDNGSGMDFDHLTKMLSFGFNEKDQYKDKKDHAPIGQYGNGFKSGSMRLAKDALVFTVHKPSETACIGLLSQTLCKDRNLSSVMFPMVEYTMPSLKRSSRGELDIEQALDAILEVSPYNSEEELKDELSTLRKQKKRSGTKIVLFNLHRTERGTFELDFHSDREDIRNPDEQQVQEAYGQRDKPFSYRQSLRRYCSILFRHSKMKIEIKGKRVDDFYFLGDLKEIKEMNYRPRGKGKVVEITFGKEKKTGSGKLEDHGVLFYHRNRLITPYVKLPCQKQQGIGQDVVGVVDVTDVLQPINNKQDFQVKNTEYGDLIRALSKKLKQYCGVGDTNVEDDDKMEVDNPEQTKSWVQCNQCKKWRRLPTDFPSDVLPKKWFCYLNPDLSRNRCEDKEEDYSQEEDLPSAMSKGKRKSTEPGKPPAGKCPRTEPPASVHAPGGLVAPGQTTVAPGQTTVKVAAPGQTTGAPGQTTVKAAPGHATVKAAPGQAAVKAAPGQAAVKAEPGQTTVKAAPGQTAVKADPGQATVAPGQAAVVPGQATVKAAPGQAIVAHDQATVGAIPVNLNPRLPSNPGDTNSVRPIQPKGQEPGQDTKAKLKTFLILTGTDRPGSSTANTQSEVPGPTKKTIVSAPVQPQKKSPPFLNPVANQRSLNSTPYLALNHGVPSSKPQGPSVMTAQNVGDTAPMPATARRKKSLNDVIKQKASDLAKCVAKASFVQDASHRSSVSTVTPSVAKQDDKNRQPLTGEKKAEPLVKREPKEQDSGTRFHRNVHRLLVHLAGACNIGDVDQIETTVQTVLESVGLEFE